MTDEPRDVDDLDDELDGALDECRFVASGPCLFAEWLGAAELGVEFLGQVRRERVEDFEELNELGLGNCLSIRERIGADHHLRDRGVEAELFDVFADLLDGLVNDALELFVGAFLRLRRILNLGRNFAFIGDCDTPDSREEAGHAFDALHLPGLHLFERAHEHFIEAQGVGAVVLHDVVGVDDVAA